MADASASPPRAPFVVGVSRSGTTMLRLMLDAHPALAIPPESRFLPGLIREVGDGAPAETAASFLVGFERWSDFHLDEAELRRRLAALGRVDAGSAARCFFELYAEAQGKKRWGDKSPPYVRHVADIARHLPEATFIHLIRDGRDVALSMMGRRRGMHRPRAIARRWVEEVKAARTQGAGLPAGRYTEVRYEDLVADSRAELERIFDLIGLEFHPRTLDFHRRAPERLAELTDIRPRDASLHTAAERMTQFERVQKPLDPARAGAWRRELAPADREAFEAVAGELLEELGYPVGPVAA